MAIEEPLSAFLESVDVFQMDPVNKHRHQHFDQNLELFGCLQCGWQQVCFPILRQRHRRCPNIGLYMHLEFQEPALRYIGHVVCLIHVICMPCASLVLEPPRKLVQVTTFATCWQLFGPRDCSSFENFVNKKMIQKRVSSQYSSTSVLDIPPRCFLRCPFVPLMTQAAAGQSIRKLAECFRASVSWLSLLSTGQFFSERMEQNAAFWKKFNFWREQTQMQAIFWWSFWCLILLKALLASHLVLQMSSAGCFSSIMPWKNTRVWAQASLIPMLMMELWTNLSLQ